MASCDCKKYRHLAPPAGTAELRRQELRDIRAVRRRLVSGAELSQLKQPLILPSRHPGRAPKWSKAELTAGVVARRAFFGLAHVAGQHFWPRDELAQACRPFLSRFSICFES